MRYDRDRVLEVASKSRQAGEQDENYAPIMNALAELFEAYAVLRPLDSNSVDKLTAAVDKLVDLTEESLSHDESGAAEEADGDAADEQTIQEAHAEVEREIAAEDKLENPPAS